MSYPGTIAQDFLGPDLGSSQMGQFAFTVGSIAYAFVANPASGLGCRIAVHKSTDVGQTWTSVGTGPTIPIVSGAGTPVWTVGRDGSNVIALWAEMKNNGLGNPWTVTHIGRAVFSLSGEAWSGQTQLPNPGLDMVQYTPFAGSGDQGNSLTLLQLIVRGPGNYILFYQGTCNILSGTPTLQRQSRVSYSTFNGSTFGPETQLPGQDATHYYLICGGCTDTNGLTTLLFTRKGWPGFAGANTVVSCSLSAANALGTPVDVAALYDQQWDGRMTVSTPAAYTTGGIAHVAFATLTAEGGPPDFPTAVRVFDTLSLASPTWTNHLLTNDQAVQPALPSHFFGYPYMFSVLSDDINLVVAWTQNNSNISSTVTTSFYYSMTPVGAFTWSTPALLWNPPALDGPNPGQAGQVNVYLTTGGFGVLGVTTSVEPDQTVRVESSFIASSTGGPSPPTITCGDPPDGLRGTPYSHAMPNTHTGSVFTVAITGGALPDGLTMDTSGLITGTPTAAGTFPYTATITDSAGTGTVDCTISIAAPSLGLGCASPPDGVVGVLYSHIFPVSGGAPPYTFAIIDGILPPGLTLDSVNGEVSGMPTLAGDYEFTIQVSDDFGSTVGTCDIVITVTDEPASGIGCDSPPGGEIGVPYSHTFPVTDIPSGATVTYSITGGALPPGLSLNTSTGQVTGTPTTDGHYHFTVTATIT